MTTASFETVVERSKRLLASLLERRGVHHVIVGVGTLDGSRRWTDAAGEANPDGSAMTVETPWLITSVTKLYIAAVVLILHEQQHIDLKAPITDYLPSGLDRLHVYDGTDYTDQVTAVHLLGHCSGLPDSLDERPPGGRSLVERVEDEDRTWTLSEAVVHARDHLTPHFPPSDPGSDRSRIRYSDTNYQLLMLMAEHVAGKPMAELFTDLIFTPLGLRRTWLPGDQPGDPVPPPATIWIGDLPLVDRPLALRSFGDLYSTVDDMLAFGNALFNGVVFDHPDTVRLMSQRFHRFGVPRGMAALRAPSWPIEYGLGMMRFEISRLLAGGRRVPGVIGHTGSTGSWLWYCPELDLVLAGTVDQTRGATIPFRQVPTVLT